jgi:hypothetical protein
MSVEKRIARHLLVGARLQMGGRMALSALGWVPDLMKGIN